MAISGNITAALGAGISNLYNPQQGAQGYVPINSGAGTGITLNGIAYPNDSSDNPEEWGNVEQLKMFIWFMKMHHEEDIKGFKAMRDIERSIELAERVERERQQMEMYQKLWTHQQSQAQQPYTSITTTASTSPYTQTSTQTSGTSFWKKLLNSI
jgi:hypothetical protein